MKPQKENLDAILKVVRQLTSLVVFLIVALILCPFILFYGDDLAAFAKKSCSNPSFIITEQSQVEQELYWSPAEVDLIQDDDLRKKVHYGKELIAHTSKYLGPKGMVRQISNGMNCQNCHLDAGTKVFGNNYAVVASTYPKFRVRSGTKEDIFKRVNDCFERSLNGQALDTMSREMIAIHAYITYIGSNVDKDIKPVGAGMKDIAFLDRAADVNLGKVVYDTKCASCHQESGEGEFCQNALEYTYPPLWGIHSYNDGAGLYRISNFAKYVKYNMPLGATHLNPNLTDEEAWDVAAYINSKPRPHFAPPGDWPDISKKPVDHPFGPFQDTFSKVQHKYGPFKPILAQRQIASLKTK